MSHVEDDQRLVDIHFQVSTCATKAHRYVVGHYLGSNHRERFGLRRVYLARHNRRAWLVLRNRQFREARSWTARHQPYVVSDLVEGNGQSTEGAGELHLIVVRALHCELVRRTDERQACEAGDFGRRGLAKAWR